jgi:Spy/CpxP family protein refolding chaperone
MHALRSLNLSDAQKQQIRGFARATRTADQNADPATKRANMQKLRAQIDGVLTPDQRTQLQAALAAPPSPAP